MSLHINIYAILVAAAHFIIQMTWFWETNSAEQPIT